MKQLFKTAVLLVLFSACVASSGCATYTTISEAEHGSAKFFSGTRLDMRAISGDERPTQKFTVSPPAHPWADLPFSFSFDLLISPLTMSAVMHEAVFD